LKEGGSCIRGVLGMNLKGGCVVREDDDEIGHYLGVLRRILILVAVIIAVLVILWTITAFIRYEGGLPKVSTFPNPLATASTNAPNRATIAEPTQQQSTPLQPADPEEAKHTDRAAPEGSSFAEHPPDPPSAPSASQTADTSSASAAIPNSATPTVAKGAHDLLPPFVANDVATSGTTSAMQPAAATEAETDVVSASAPLSGPIPLPRPRPHEAGALRTADRVPSPVPTPRPRPAVGDPGAQQETTTNSPSVPPQQR
jgi:hypothetical protein